MSKKPVACSYGHALPNCVMLNNVKIPATMGELALVPPIAYHCPPLYTATLVAASATAATSAFIRRGQPVSVWKGGLAMTLLQPLPPDRHAVSAHPRVDPDRTSVVPPTASTCGADAGYE